MVVSPDPNQVVYALEHIETRRLICALHESHDYLVCFTDRKDAEELREAMGLQDYCDIAAQPMSGYPVSKFWLDGEFVELGGPHGGIGPDP